MNLRKTKNPKVGTPFKSHCCTKQIHATLKLNKCSFLFLFNFDLNDLSSVFVVRSCERESGVTYRITCTAYAAMPVQL